MLARDPRSRQSVPSLDGALEGNSLVFGPGGQASIVAPLNNGEGDDGGSQGSDGSTSQDSATDQPSLLFPTDPAPVIKQQTEPPTTSSALRSTSSATSGFASDTSASAISAISTQSPSSVAEFSTISGSISSALFLTVASSASTSASSLGQSVATTMDIPSTPLSSASSAHYANTASSGATSVSGSADSSATALNANHVSTYAGIAFGAIAGVAFLVVLLIWWLRSRRHSHGPALESVASWPWDKDSPSVDIDDHQSDLKIDGGNLSSHHDPGLWDEIDLSRHDPGAAYPDVHRLDEGNPRDSHAHTLPPLPPHIRGFAGVYPTVQVHSASSSVPDLAPAMGTLQVANYVPGDLSSGSGDEASRASTALGMFSTSHAEPPECGTPYDPMGGERPRFLGLDGNGLGVPWAPWAPLQPRKQQPLEQTEEMSVRDLGPMPYPGDGPAEMEAGGWAASIRSNLVSAFNAVVGASSTEETSGDHLTHLPCRMQRSIKAVQCGPSNTGILSRTNTVHSVHSDIKQWISEDTRDGTGVVHICPSDDAEPLPVLEQEAEDPTKSSAESVTVVILEGQGASLSRSSSLNPVTPVCSLSTSGGLETMPPRLPSIPSMSRSSSQSSLFCTEQSERPERIRRKNTKARFNAARRRTRGSLRPAALVRAPSSYCSAVSVGSDISRQSSVRSERLTDAEKFARRMLRERRKRIMEMDAGRKHAKRSTKRIRQPDVVEDLC